MIKIIKNCAIVLSLLTAAGSFSATSADILLLYSLNAGEDSGLVSVLSQQDNEPVVRLNVSSTAQLIKKMQVNVRLPTGELVSGIVSNKFDTSPVEAAVLSGKTSTTVIAFENNKGSLELNESNQQIVSMRISNSVSGEIYQAQIDNQGEGRFIKQDISKLLCTDYDLVPYTPGIQSLMAVQHTNVVPELAELKKLSSKPNSSKVLYINMWGGVLKNTYWNDAYAGGYDMPYEPYDIDFDSSSFSAEELEGIWSAWREVAEDYAIFDINVTTDQAIYDATDPLLRVQIIQTPSQQFFGAGGVAIIGGMDNYNDYYKTGWSWNTGLSKIGITISHEAGHQMGLEHDNAYSRDYYSGHGDWGPIMGAPYGQKYIQWSKGDYRDALQHQDDLAIIKRAIGVVPDDAGDTSETAVELVFPVAEYQGQITPGGLANDIDVYKFSLTSQATINIDISSLLRSTLMQNIGANLAFNADLTNSNGEIIAAMNSSDISPLTPENNTFNYAGPLAADTYYLTIDAVSPDQDWATGFDDYGNGGQYVINIDAGDGGTDPDPGTDNDTDKDGIANDLDNCPGVANPEQLNTDGAADGGNACDLDDDNDGFSDLVELEEASDPLNAADKPADLDNDLIPDSTDSDRDGDGVDNVADEFPDNGSESVDSDADGLGNNADTDDDNDGYSDQVELVEGSNPLDATSQPADLDNDKIPDSTDNDRDGDGDGVDNSLDAFPDNNSESVDTDGDSIGNNSDTDDDNDGYSDLVELSQGSDPLDATSKPIDLDNDNIPDSIDNDRDGDGVDNDTDAFPNDKDESVDTDSDGIGNNSDTDDDNDGVSDELELEKGSDPLDPDSKPDTAEPTDVLTNGQSVMNLAAANGEHLMYRINIPEGSTNLKIKSSGGSGDLDLHVAFNRQPTLTDFDYRPWLGGNTEQVTIATPNVGTYYVMLNAYSAFSGAELVASFDETTEPQPDPEPNPDPEPDPQPEPDNDLPNACASQSPEGYIGLTGGIPICLSADNGSYYIYLNTNPAKVTIRTAGGEGNVNIYASMDIWPDAANYQYSSTNPANVEQIEIINPGNGWLLIAADSDSTSDGVTLQLDIEP